MNNEQGKRDWSSLFRQRQRSACIVPPYIQHDRLEAESRDSRRVEREWNATEIVQTASTIVRRAITQAVRSVWPRFRCTRGIPSWRHARLAHYPHHTHTHTHTHSHTLWRARAASAMFVNQPMTNARSGTLAKPPTASEEFVSERDSAKIIDRFIMGLYIGETVDS